MKKEVRGTTALGQNMEFILKYRSGNKRLQAVWSTFRHRMEKDYRIYILTYVLYTTKEVEFIITGLRGPIIRRHIQFNSIQFICIAQFHKLQICLGVLYNLYT